MATKQEIEQRKQQLLEKTAAFCDAHLDEEYKTLCARLIEKMARKREVPFQRGGLDNWAAGIVHALGSANFLFDSSQTPHVRASAIAEYFKVSPSTASQKAAAIRDLMRLEQSPEFATRTMIEHEMDMQGIIVQAMQSLLPDVPPEVLLDELSTIYTGGDIGEDDFVDEERAAMHEYYDLCQLYERSGPTPKLERELRRLIEADPDFFDSYLMLRDILEEHGKAEEAQQLLDTGYERALHLVTVRTGEWPELLEWGWLANRHILRMFLNKAMDFWAKGNTEESLGIFRKLLPGSPDDNIGARYYILGIRCGMSLDDFEEKFDKDGFYDMSLDIWFDKNSPKYPEEFAAWKKLVKDEA